MATPIPTLVLVRPLDQAKRFLASVEARVDREFGAVLSPIIDIQKTRAAVDLSEYDGVILTSENGLLGLDTSQATDGRTAWCVGPRTAEAAAAMGFRTIVGDGSAEALMTLIADARPSGRLVHPCGRHATLDFEAGLSGAGVDVEAVVVYDQAARSLSPEAREVLASGPAVVPLFSPRSARLLREEAPAIAPTVRPIVMSEAVAEAWGVDVPRPRISAQPNGAAMLDAVADELNRDAPC